MANQRTLCPFPLYLTTFIWCHTDFPASVSWPVCPSRNPHFTHRRVPPSSFMDEAQLQANNFKCRSFALLTQLAVLVSSDEQKALPGISWRERLCRKSGGSPYVDTRKIRRLVVHFGDNRINGVMTERSSLLIGWRTGCLRIPQTYQRPVHHSLRSCSSSLSPPSFQLAQVVTALGSDLGVFPGD